MFPFDCLRVTSVSRKLDISTYTYQSVSNMYLATIRQIPRPYRVPLVPLIRSGRALSTLVDGEVYWKGTPWKDVPAEEFNSYRWQVSQASDV
jgi:hypothetical protein